MAMPPENEETCTCLCTPCAEFAGCAACPECTDGCEACGYTIIDDTVPSSATPALNPETREWLDQSRQLGAVIARTGWIPTTPEPTGPSGFAAGPMIIDEAGPNHWTGAP